MSGLNWLRCWINVLSIDVLSAAADALYKVSELITFKQMHWGALLKQWQRIKWRHSRFKTIIFYETTLYKKGSLLQPKLGAKILYFEENKILVEPFHKTIKKEFILQKDTLFIQKALILLRADCSLRGHVWWDHLITRPRKHKCLCTCGKYANRLRKQNSHFSSCLCSTPVLSTLSSIGSV